MIKDKIDQMSMAFHKLEQATETARLCQREFNDVFASTLNDLSLIPYIYKWYRDCAAENKFSSDRRNNNYKQFIFIILLLYSPASLFGGKIRNDLRTSIADLLHLRANTIVYHMRDRVVVWIGTYKIFADEVAIAYEDIMMHLNISKLSHLENMGSLPLIRHSPLEKS